MKIGYSISVGEHVNATDIEYQDISDFKIVCPICREPVHKVERGDQHFLSHKNKIPGETGECEMRVASFTRTQLDALDCLARGQTLQAFFADLPDMIDAVMPREQADVPNWREIAQRHQWRPDARRMRAGHKAYVMKYMKNHHIADNLEVALREEHHIYAVAPSRSRLNRHLQKRAAMDMYRTLITPAGKIGFEHLYWASWCTAWIRYSLMPESEIVSYITQVVGNGGVMKVPDIREPLLSFFAHSCEDKIDFDRLVKRSSKKLLWDEPHSPAYLSVNGKAMNDIWTAMMSILVNLDYVSAAKRRHTNTL